MKYESIDHPDHYQSSQIEAIDVIENYGLDFSLGNAVKYILRAGRKPESSYVEDLSKASWYINREIERVKKYETDSRQEPQDVHLSEVREHAPSFLPCEERPPLCGQSSKNASIPF